MTPISLGLDTFGDVSHGPDGKPQPMDVVLREVLDPATITPEGRQGEHEPGREA